MPDGSTYRAQLESLERQTGRRPPELDGPDLPPDTAHVWSWFLDLAQARGSSGFGPAPISFADVLAWRVLMGVIIRPFEVELIMAIDQAWLMHSAGMKAAQQAAQPSGKGKG